MIYVDEIRDGWCHMMTDSNDLTELHTMAVRIGIKYGWFQQHPLHPHYDLRASKRRLAIIKGAKPVTRRELVLRCSKFAPIAKFRDAKVTNRPTCRERID